MALEPDQVAEHAVLSGLKEAIFVVNTESQVVYANDRLAEILALRRADLVGTPLTAFRDFVEDGFARLGRTIDDVLDGDGTEQRVEIETVHPDAAPVPKHVAAEARVKRLECGDGQLGALVVLRNISERKEMEETLRRREQRLQTMFEAHSAPMLLIEPESGRIRDANRAAVGFYGYDAGTLVRMNIQEINTLSPEEIARERERATENDRNHFEFEHRLASGDTRLVEVHSSPVTVDGEHLLFSIVHDITQRKEYEHELQLFREAVEQAAHSVLITDSNGVIEYVNPAFEDNTGYDRTEAVGKTPNLLRSGKQDAAFYDAMWETILDGEVWEADLINQRKSGELYYAEHKIAPIIRDGDITDFVAIQSDITDTKLREKRLSELNRILRHNLRNALTVIVGHAEALADAASATQRSRIAEILEQATDLAETSEKVNLVQQHLGDEGDGKSTCDLEATLDRLTTAVRDRYPDTTIRTDPAAVTVEIDAATCWIVLTELVDNAVRFNDRSDPELTISVDVPDDEAKQIRLSVADNGPGIPEQERSAVELGVEDQLAHSSGIGLSHVHWIVTDCGGEITISDNEPRGSVVTLSLPRADTA